MKLSLIGAFAVIAALSGCANTQKGRCDCCQVGSTEVSSRSFADLTGIDTSSRNHGRAHQ
jgi:hypothetical protein